MNRAAWRALLLFWLGWLSAAPVGAQVQTHPVTAWRLVELEGAPARPELLPLPGGDVLLLRRVDPGRYVLERLDPQLRPRWFVPVDLPEPRSSNAVNRLASATQIMDITSIDRVLTADDTRALWVQRSGTQVTALTFDLETGAEERVVLAEVQAEDVQIGLLVNGGRVAVVTDTPRARSRRIDVFTPQFTLDTTLRVELTGTEQGLWLSPEGRVLAARLVEGPKLRVERLSPSGSDASLLLDLSGSRVRAVRLAFGLQGELLLAARVDGSRPRGDGLLVASLDPELGSAKWASILSQSALLAGTGEVDLGTLNLQDIVPAPDGSMLVHGQLVQQVLVTSPSPTGLGMVTLTTSDVELRLGAALVFCIDQGALRWSTAAGMNQAADPQEAFVETGYSLRLMEDEVWLFHLYTPTRVDILRGRPPTRSVVLHRIRLSDGQRGTPEDVLSLSRNETWLRALSTPVNPRELVFTTSYRYTERQTLVSRVDLSAPPLAEAPVDRTLTGDPTSEDYQAGWLVGHKTGLTDVQGLAFLYGGGLGVGGTAAAMTGAWALTGFNPTACLVGGAIGCGGAMGAARFTGGRVHTQPWGHLSADFQAGYAEGFQRGKRLRQLRWAALGGGAAAVAVGASLGTAQLMLEAR